SATASATPGVELTAEVTEESLPPGSIAVATSDSLPIGIEAASPTPSTCQNPWQHRMYFWYYATNGWTLNNLSPQYEGVKANLPDEIGNLAGSMSWSIDLPAGTTITRMEPYIYGWPHRDIIYSSGGKQLIVNGERSTCGQWWTPEDGNQCYPAEPDGFRPLYWEGIAAGRVDVAITFGSNYDPGTLPYIDFTGTGTNPFIECYTPTPTNTPSPTPTPTFTPTPPFCSVGDGYAGASSPVCQPLPLCQGVVNTTSQDGFGLRSGASTNSQLLARLIDDTAITILGRFYSPEDDSTWYRVSHNGQIGWMRDDGVSYDLFTCGELEVLDGDGNTAIVSLAAYDYEMEAPDPSWETITCSADALGIENWRNCAKFVYFRYYHTFHTELERYPRLSDVIAAVYNGEMSSLYSQGVPDVGINLRNGVPKLDIAFEAISRNFWSVIVSHGGEDKRLTLNQLLEEYLVQVQSWYQLANAGQPDLTAIARALVYEPLNYQPIANRVLQQEWGVTAESVRQWGNYPFNGPTSDYNSLYTAQPIAYCITVRAFRDADTDLDALTRQDAWNDYRFALTIGSYGTVGTYNQAVHPAPAWLKQRDASDPEAYYRNTVVDTTPGDNAEGRVFLSCSEVIQALDPNSIPNSP
ncbi:MAG: SH3 domain-containing protein, partial [Anaerolineae bacterium]|nr:SH3 domain-containing protein [Anaerolineae bacterium]